MSLLADAPASEGHMRRMGDASAAVRAERCEQRRALRENSTPQSIVRALVDPPPALATYRLFLLFAPSDNAIRGLIPGMGETGFGRAMRRLRAEGCLWADSRVRLRELTKQQRRQLARVILSVAPREWLDAGGLKR